MELYRLTIHELRSLLDRGEVTASEVLSSVQGRIEAVEGRVHAYTTLTPERAIAMLEGKGALAGIPLAIKDNMCIKGVRTTCSSKILSNFIPPYESTVTQKLADEGYVLLGKTNLDEFAMGSSTENSAYGMSHNPWDLQRVPGGSSGGSAAAVAADECIAAIGSDTGGSIRQPAAFCGVVGLKPTYGRVSRYGLVAFASSLDQVGPITKDVRDAAIMLNVISGRDERDSTSAPVDVPDYTALLGRDIKGLRVGVAKQYNVEGMDPEIEAAFKAALITLKSLGAEIIEVDLPHTQYAVPTYYILATSEASSNLARYDGVKYGHRTGEAKDLSELYLKSRAEGFGAEVKRRIMLGTYALSSGYYDAYYIKAQRARTLIKRDFDEAFKSVDAIATPTAPEVAFKAGEKTADPLKMYLSDIFTISVNLAGVPGISLPCGFNAAGLPVGLQLIGKNFDEQRLLGVAHAYEQASGWRSVRRPSL